MVISVLTFPRRTYFCFTTGQPLCCRVPQNRNITPWSSTACPSHLTHASVSGKSGYTKAPRMNTCGFHILAIFLFCLITVDIGKGKRKKKHPVQFLLSLLLLLLLLLFKYSSIYLNVRFFMKVHEKAIVKYIVLRMTAPFFPCSTAVPWNRFGMYCWL